MRSGKVRLDTLSRSSHRVSITTSPSHKHGCLGVESISRLILVIGWAFDGTGAQCDG